MKSTTSPQQIEKFYNKSNKWSLGIITRWTWGRFLLWCMCIKKGIQLLL